MILFIIVWKMVRLFIISLSLITGLDLNIVESPVNIQLGEVADPLKLSN